MYRYNRNLDEYYTFVLYSFIERCPLFGVSFIGGFTVYIRTT